MTIVSAAMDPEGQLLVLMEMEVDPVDYLEFQEPMEVARTCQGLVGLAMLVVESNQVLLDLRTSPLVAAVLKEEAVDQVVVVRMRMDPQAEVVEIANYHQVVVKITMDSREGIVETVVGQVLA